MVNNAAADKARAEELFAFRAAIAASEPQATTEHETPKSSAIRIVTFAAVAVAALLVVVLAYLAFPKIAQGKAPALYIDMGNRRFDPAGLSGRLIARWEGSPSYQLYLDPVDQQDAAAFQTLAVNPPQPLSVLIRLLDPAGMVACQKEIVFPSAARPGKAIDPTQALLPETTSSGDKVQDMAGPDGQIAEITASGPLPCSLQQYQRLSSWEFVSNYPTDADQKGALKQSNSQSLAPSPERRRSSVGWHMAPVQFQRLTAPIEGDDVIVGDNPATGVVDTGGGRVFAVGATGWRARTAEWQIFPAAIHFRCERTGVCTLTHVTSRTTLQARLVR